MASRVQWSEVTALFGGTFDPPHDGHREAVRGLFRSPGVRRVIVLPAATPPLRSVATPAEHRAALAELCFGVLKEPVKIDHFEIESARPGQPSYTRLTLEHFKREIPELAFVIGTDQLGQLDRWNGFPEILKLCHWIVLARKPAGVAPALRVIAQWKASGLILAGEGTVADQEFPLVGGRTWLTIVATEAPALSATRIREAVARTGRFPEGSVAPEVARYCIEHGLYGTKA